MPRAAIGGLFLLTNEQNRTEQNRTEQNRTEQNKKLGNFNRLVKKKSREKLEGNLQIEI